MPPPKRVWKATAKLGVDCREGIFEFLPRDLIEFGDGLLRILDGFDEIVALAAQERVALLTFLVFLERHHVDRAHGFDARFHVVVGRLRGGEFFAGQQIRLQADQFLGLRVQFGDAGLAQIFAVGIVAGLFDFAMIALRALVIE